MIAREWVRCPICSNNSHHRARHFRCRADERVRYRITIHRLCFYGEQNI